MKFLLTLSVTFCIILSFTVSAHAQWFSVKKSSPAKGEKDVPLDKIIEINFTEALNTSRINTGLLVEMPSKSSVPANLTYSEDRKTMYIHPKSLLKRGAYYVITLSTIESISTKPIHQYHSNIDFTTVGGQFFCVAYATPSEIFISPGGFKDVTYSFIEQGGGWGEIMRCSLVYEDSSGRELIRNTEEMKLIIPDKQTVKLNSTVSMPLELGNQILGQTIYIRRIFEGLDHENNRLTIRTGVKATVGQAPQAATSMNEILIKSPEYGSVIPRESIIPIEGVIRGVPGTQIHGCWLFNGTPMGFFASTIPPSGELKQTISDRSFASKDGYASISLQMISPEKKTSDRVDYMVSSSPLSSCILMQPKSGAIFKKSSSTPPNFRWSMVQGAISYKVAISKSRDIQNAVWVNVDNNLYVPDWVKWSSLGVGTFYWSVKPIFPGNKEGDASPSLSFSIAE